MSRPAITMPFTARENRLYRDVEFLTSLRPFRNWVNLESLKKCCSYIEAEFSKSGYEVTRQTWKVHGNDYTNLIASFAPDKQKRLIVGAHYDVAGEQPGADDNASAIAGLLETARLLAQTKPDLDYGVDLVAYCLEEPPFFGTPHMGSYIHAQSLYESKADVLGMINYEMIGYFTEEPNTQTCVYIPELKDILPTTGNFIFVVGQQGHGKFTENVYNRMKEGGGVDVRMHNFPDGGGFAGFSDHRNYWKFGYPALMITDTGFERNHNYHRLTDTIETLNFEKMAAVINSTFVAINQL
ncbi:M28 family peptidase [Salinimicrobium soli]|uniref:M28 family peptidase n=1 Tax=Salinimicrobium soli TaxID=1254399 RepID=UPI003AADBB37